MDCIFCKIANKEIPSDIVFENENVLAFNDIEPKAPVHILIIPKRHIDSIDKIEEVDKELVGELFLVGSRLAREKGLTETGYRLIINLGKDAGQTVDHLHVHLLGGKKLPFA